MTMMVVLLGAGADQDPDQFNFTDKLEANLNLDYYSYVTPVGFATSQWSVSGGLGSTDNVTFSTSGTIILGQNFYVKGNSGPSFSASNTITATIGTITDNFIIYTRAADVTGDAFTFDTINGANPGSTQYSNQITVQGLEPNYTGITVTATNGYVDAGTTSLSGTYEISKTNIISSATGTIVVKAYGTASSSFGGQTIVGVTIGGTTVNFTINTRIANIIPGTFSFASVGPTGVNPGSTQTSSTVTVYGLEPSYSSVTVSGTGGLIDAGTTGLSGNFQQTKYITTSGSGSLVVAAQGTACTSFGQSNTVTVTVGSGSALFVIYTKAADTTPNSFTIPNNDNVEPSVDQYSQIIQVSGVEPNYPISVTATPYDLGTNLDWGGKVDVNTVSGNLSGTSSANYSTSKSITTSTGSFFLRAYIPGRSTFGGVSDVKITVGTYSTGFTVHTRNADTTPKSWSFNTPPLAERSTLTYSDTITVSELEPNYGLFLYTASNFGEISINGGAYSTSVGFTTSSTGTFTIRARVTSSANFNSSVTMTVKGLASDYPFTVTTRLADTNPDPYAFLNATNVAVTNPGTVTDSNLVKITGLEPSYSVSLSSTTFSYGVNTTGADITFFNSPSSYTADASGQIWVKLRGTAATTVDTTVSGSLTVGSGTNATAPWSITTRIPDTVPETPADLTAYNVSNATRNQSYTTTDIYVSVLEKSYTGVAGKKISVTVSTGTVDVGTTNTTYSGTPATTKDVVTNSAGGFYMKLTASASSQYGTPVNVTVTVGNATYGTKTYTWTITTIAADVAPDPFYFTSVGPTGVNPGSTQTSNTATVTGLQPSYGTMRLIATGGSVDAGTSALSGTFANFKDVTTSGTGTLAVALRGTASSTFGGSTTVSANVGTGTGSYIIYTRAADTTPNPFDFTDVTGVTRGSTQTSNTATVAGLEPSYTGITVSATGSIGASFQINAGTSTLGTWGSLSTTSPKSITNLTTSSGGSIVVAVRLLADSAGTTRYVDVTIGGVTGRYIVTPA